MKGNVVEIMMKYSSSKQLSFGKCCHKMAQSQVAVDTHTLS